MRAIFDPATPQGFLLVLLQSRLDAVKAAPTRGASAIEWVIITAILVTLAGVVGGIIYQLVSDRAAEIVLPGNEGT